ncbi:MAG: PSD1 and planctomycete cytochrome C domain-containing protein [Pirellulaceae bacterium]
MKTRVWISASILILLYYGEIRAEDLTYEEHIRPIFRAHCFDCHGATDEFQGGLDLRLVRTIIQGGDSGAAIMPMNPQESYLIERLRSGEMPPGNTRVPEAEIKTIEEWIAAGAKTARPEPESIGRGLGITPEERAFWYFQSIQRPDVPTHDPSSRMRTPIDALVLQDMDPETRGFEVDADRRALVLRVYFSLTGLPPQPDEVARWVSDPNEDWYDSLVSELLDSPHYGERWARHWLDIAGYADSEGYTTADTERPWAYKYRDWVIRALNADMPLDQFVTQQLAGDELAGPKSGDYTPEQIDLLTATGFLRMAADGTGSGANNDEGRNQVMTDNLQIVGTALLGLSIHCAQCHDHRYDPIPQSDYYALRAVFEPALDWQAWEVPSARLVSLYTEEDHQAAAEIEVEAKQVEAERNELQAEYMKQAIEMELMKFEEPLRGQLRSAYETPAAERNDEQKKLLSENPSVNITPGNLYQYIPESRTKLDEIGNRIEAIRAKKPVHEYLRALVEPANHTQETRLFHRGDFRQPMDAVAPAPLSVASPIGNQIEFASNDDSLPSTGRRLAFARWLTSSENPFFARVMVNRIWMHHFGKGLVPTPGEFGRLGTVPTDQQLLDWLASEFIAQGYSLKKLHQLILTSTVFRQSTVPQSANPYARSLRRLEAETIRDRALAATGSLDRALFGKPLKIKEDETGQVVVDGPQTRRSLYIQVRRSRPVALLQAFDAPVMETNCASRTSSTVATQSLMLLNGSFILEQAALLAERAEREAAPLEKSVLEALPKIPLPAQSNWQYGFGSFDESENRTGSFTPFPHFNSAAQWAGGEKVPDPTLGYAFLTASGGHPDGAGKSVIRRWIAPLDATIQIEGTLTHGSANADGVRGRIVSSRLGKAGEWIAQHGSVDTNVKSFEVQAGDYIDFVTDSRENITSDSFNWIVRLSIPDAEKPRVVSSQDQFAGPVESTDSIPGQIARAWELAYCRKPTSDELASAVKFVSHQIETMNESSTPIPQGRTATRQSMTNLCQNLLTSNEFLYVE